MSAETSGPTTFLADTKAHLCSLLERNHQLEKPVTSMSPSERQALVSQLLKVLREV